jgi:hypothetical protein
MNFAPQKKHNNKYGTESVYSDIFDLFERSFPNTLDDFICQIENYPGTIFKDIAQKNIRREKVNNYEELIKSLAPPIISFVSAVVVVIISTRSTRKVESLNKE